MAEAAADPDAGTEERTTLELQRLRHEIQKLALEIDALRSSGRWERLVGRHLPIVTALLAIAGFWVGIFQYYATSREAQQQRAIESRRESAGINRRRRRQEVEDADVAVEIERPLDL